MYGPSGNFPSSPDVSLDFVSVNIRTLGKTKPYLPTPRVQKPGDSPKNFQSGNHFY